MRRKKKFTLVEVVIALAIFSLCALPLLRQPFILSANNYNSLYQSELLRHANVTHCMLLSHLYTADISWSSLPKNQKTKYTPPNVPCRLLLGKKIQRSFIQKTTISHENTKKISNEQNAHLLEITIAYLPKAKKQSKEPIYKFSYLVTVIGPSES